MKYLVTVVVITATMVSLVRPREAAHVDEVFVDLILLKHVDNVRAADRNGFPRPLSLAVSLVVQTVLALPLLEGTHTR